MNGEKKQPAKAQSDSIELLHAREQLELLRRYKDTGDRLLRDHLDTDLCDIFDAKLETPAGMIAKLEMAIARDESRPRNKSIFWFAMDADLPNIRGPHATFLPELKVSDQDTVAERDEFRKMLGTMLSNAKNVSAQYLYDIESLLNSFPRTVIEDAIDGGPDDYDVLLGRIATKLCQWRKIPNVPEMRPRVQTMSGIVEPRNRAGTHKVFVDRNTKKISHSIFIFIGNIEHALQNNSANYNKASRELQKRMLFVNVLISFVHEFNHFVDYVAPDRGALGSQVATLGRRVYSDSTQEIYESNATEVASNATEDPIGPAIAKWLENNYDK